MAMFNRILIMGAGALGSLFGGLLYRAGFDVTLVGRKIHVEAIKKHGLEITGLIEETLEIPAVEHPVEADLVLMTVKSYDTATASKQLIIGERTIVVSLQNGLGNEEVIASVIGPDRVLGGVTSYGSLLIEPGKIEFTGKGVTFIGEMDGQMTKRIEMVEGIFTEAGIETYAVSNIREKLWEKLIINAVINPITALCRVPNGSIQNVMELRELAECIIDECLEVAKANGFEFKDMLEKVLYVAEKTARNRSSMLQDVERKKRTEIDAINGMIMKKGEEKGIDVNINSILVTLIKGLEAGYRHGY
jgi:2-dehydropantoate 2-reductase